MNSENLEEILKMSEKDFEKEAEKIPIMDMIARIEKWKAILNMKDLGMPALIGSEITPKRQKLSSLLHILTAVKEAKQKERFELGQKEKEKWRNEYVRDNLRDFRYVIGYEAEHLMHGTFTMDAVGWQTPQCIEFEIIAVSGNKVKINLQKLISPQSLNALIAKAFSPFYLIVEPSGMYQHNKRLGLWQSGEWDQTRGITYRAGTMIAIMKV